MTPRGYLLLDQSWSIRKEGRKDNNIIRNSEARPRTCYRNKNLDSLNIEYSNNRLGLNSSNSKHLFIHNNNKELELLLKLHIAGIRTHNQI